MAGGAGQIRAGKAFVEFATTGQDTVRKAFIQVQASMAHFARSVQFLASTKLTKLKRSLRYAEIQLARFSRRLQRSISRAMVAQWRALTSAVNRFGAALMHAAKYGAMALGALAGAVLVKAIKQASDFGETVSKFNIVFGDNAKAMRAWAEEYGAAIGRSKQEMLDFMATSKGFLVPMGIDEAQADKMSQVLTQLSFDLGSLHNIADEDAFEKLRAGLSGEAEPLKVLGVVLNEAAVEAELLAHGIEKINATEAQKVMARYNIILRSTSLAQGDAERTSDSFANKVKALQAAWSDFLVIVGEKLIPYATVLVDWLTKLLRSTELTGEAVDGATSSFNQAGTASEFLITALDWMIKGFHGLNAVIQTAFALVEGFYALLANVARFLIANPLSDSVFGEETIDNLEAGLKEAEKYLTESAQKRLESAGASLDILDDENVGRDFLAGFRSSVAQASNDLKEAAKEAENTVAIPFEAIENFGPAIDNAKDKAKKVAEQIEVVSPDALEGMAAYEQFRENNRLKETALLAKAAEALKKAIENPAIALATVE